MHTWSQFSADGKDHKLIPSRAGSDYLGCSVKPPLKMRRGYKSKYQMRTITEAATPVLWPLKESKVEVHAITSAAFPASVLHGTSEPGDAFIWKAVTCTISAFSTELVLHHHHKCRNSSKQRPSQGKPDTRLITAKLSRSSVTTAIGQSEINKGNAPEPH